MYRIGYEEADKKRKEKRSHSKQDNYLLQIRKGKRLYKILLLSSYGQAS